MRLAIFDFDDTLLQGNSWHLFLRAELRRQPSRIPLLLGAYALRRLHLWTGIQLRALVVRGLRGFTRESIQQLGENFYCTQLAARVRRAGLAEIEQHRAAGDRIVLATGAWDFLVAPLVSRVTFDAVIATPLAYAGERCLGSIVGAERLGLEKAAAVSAHFADQPDVEWAASCVYTDSLLDVPLLELVGNRRLVTANREVPSGFPMGTQACLWPDP